MNRTNLIRLVLSTLGIAVSVFIYSYFFYYKTQRLSFPSGQVFEVRIADNAYKQMRGLMNIKELSQDHGMLFIFTQTAKHAFWMKNTQIPLDIIWLDENLLVVGIKNSAPPCLTQTCVAYSPPATSKYVLEVNAEMAQKNDLKIGDLIELVE